LKRRSGIFLLLCILLTGVALPGSGAPSPGPAQAAPIASRSFFGMNLYVSGLERPKAEKLAILEAATDIGVKWSREEMPWANLEPDRKGIYNWSAYDPWILDLLGSRINIIGVIQTTPYWASGVPKTDPDWYWYAPTNLEDFADFAYAAALHYKGKIKVWELWNEPDVDITFKCRGCNPVTTYAKMLELGYAAIKRADPSAIVLVGGLSVHDHNNQGMAFLEQVVRASGGKLNFDVLSIHPYMPDRHPESTDPKTVVQNFPYRLENAYKWLQAHGAPTKEIWITENGYSTCTACGNLGVSEEEQAVRLVRLHAIAMAAPNVTHFNYFQMKDKFNGGASDLWGNMGILRNDLSPKPAYRAYKTLTRQLEGASYAGPGPLMRAVQNRWQTQHDRYHYRFAREGALVSVIWKIGDRETVSVEVTQQNVTVQDVYGQRVQSTRRDNTLTFAISESPIYVVEAAASAVLDPAADPSSPTGYKPSAGFLDYWQKNGGLTMFGYPISPERLEKSPTDGKQYIVQWFERARFEYHPEYTGTGSEVLLGLLGSQLAAGRTFPTIAPPQGVEAVCSNETGHCVWGRFLERWRELTVPIVGLPLSDQFEERSTDGKSYTVQYFERARFEYHPENSPPHDILLGLLGRQLYKP
jgi:hypothetical protein